MWAQARSRTWTRVLGSAVVNGTHARVGESTPVVPALVTGRRARLAARAFPIALLVAAGLHAPLAPGLIPGWLRRLLRAEEVLPPLPDEVIVPIDVYGGTYRLLNRVFAGFNLRITPVDTTDLAAVAAAVTATTRLVWLETPTNPRLLVSDIRAIAALAHATGALVVVDNTFATPVFQQPFSLGADLVVHSVTKYLAGHSDLIQGAVLARDAAVFEPVKFLQNAIGAVPAPLDCWLTMRGLKTLELRVQRHAENAGRIAVALTAHPAVSRVYYPGLADHPGHQVAKQQMTGFGGMLSFELKGTADDVTTFVSNRRLFTLGESLGGVRSLICHPARMTHASIPADQRAALGLSDRLIRLSPGIEHADDLIDDLVEGLEIAATSSMQLEA